MKKKENAQEHQVQLVSPEKEGYLLATSCEEVSHS